MTDFRLILLDHTTNVYDPKGCTYLLLHVSCYMKTLIFKVIFILGYGLSPPLKNLLTEFLKESMQHADEIAQRQIVICNDALYLMKFREMCGVQRLIPEHTVYGEVLDGREFLLI